jgi:TetR/AcrR family transcriptional regulator
LNKVPRNRAKALPQQDLSSRDAILSAALKAFAQGGFEGASLPKIAKIAKVAPPLIHYHFGSKDNLWRETVDHSLGDLRREAAAICCATRTLAPLDRLRALLQAIAHFAARCPDHFSMIMAEARSDSDRFAWVQKNYTGVLFADVLKILQDAKDKSLIKDIAIDQVASMLIGGILVWFTIDRAKTTKRDVMKLADEYTDLMFVMLLDGLAVKPGGA